jgi:hypothetical protein
MKNIIYIVLIASMTSCVDVTVDTKGAGEVAHEAGSLIRDGVKGGIQLYKESKKDSTNLTLTLKKDSTDLSLNIKKDSITFWQKVKNKAKIVTNKK